MARARPAILLGVGWIVLGCYTKAPSFPRAAAASRPQVQIIADLPESEPYLKGMVRSRSAMYRQYYSPNSLQPLLVAGLFLYAGAAQSRTQQEWSVLQGFFNEFDAASVAQAATSGRGTDRPPNAVPPVAASENRILARPFLMIQEGAGRLLYSSVVLEAELAGSPESRPWKGLYSYHIPMALSASTLVNNPETVDAQAYRRMAENGVEKVLELLQRDIRGELPWDNQHRAFVETKEFLGFPLGVGAGYDVLIVEEQGDEVILRFEFNEDDIAPGGVHILQRSQMDSFQRR